jgi:hypothetical protein
MLTAPPLPDADEPEATVTWPLELLVEEPDAICTAPLLPLAPPSADATRTSPLAELVAAPLTSESIPPVPLLAVPADSLS